MWTFLGVFLAGCVAIFLTATIRNVRSDRPPQGKVTRGLRRKRPLRGWPMGPEDWT